VVRISKIKNAGYGLFAGEHIKKGQVIDGTSTSNDAVLSYPLTAQNMWAKW
jgi:hypothetical protein